MTSFDLDNDSLMYPHKVAKKLSVSKRYVYILIESGKLQGVRISEAGIRVTRSSVCKYLESLNPQ